MMRAAEQGSIPVTLLGAATYHPVLEPDATCLWTAAAQQSTNQVRLCLLGSGQVKCL